MWSMSTRLKITNLANRSVLLYFFLFSVFLTNNRLQQWRRSVITYVYSVRHVHIYNQSSKHPETEKLHPGFSYSLYLLPAATIINDQNVVLKQQFSFASALQRFSPESMLPTSLWRLQGESILCLFQPLMYPPLSPMVCLKARPYLA